VTTLRSSQHSNLIASAAKARLSPLGFVRKGRSRLWLKDNVWWLSAVEFQPSAWSKGTYLNVAATWLWHEKEYLAFDECQRVEGFAEYTDPETFAVAADKYALRAAAEAQNALVRFATVGAVAAHLCSSADGNPWRHYHAMMALLVTGNIQSANDQLRSLLRVDHNVPWCIELKEKATTFARQATTTEKAREVVLTEIALARARLKLAALNDATLLRGITGGAD
jgi:hypothetical protein